MPPQGGTDFMSQFKDARTKSKRVSSASPRRAGKQESCLVKTPYFTFHLDAMLLFLEHNSVRAEVRAHGWPLTLPAPTKLVQLRKSEWKMNWG